MTEETKEQEASAVLGGQNERLVMRGSEIKNSHWHDAGAFGRCSYCGRYSDEVKCLDDDFECDCGKKNGFSGSFKKPEPDSLWNA